MTITTVNGEQGKPTESVAVLGKDFPRAGDELVTGQAAEAARNMARKQLAVYADLSRFGHV